MTDEQHAEALKLAQEVMEEHAKYSNGAPTSVCEGSQCAIAEALVDLSRIRDEQAALAERTAQIAAHRACCGTEHDPSNGKFHGFCIVCGVPWPCEYAGKPPSDEQANAGVPNECPHGYAAGLTCPACSAMPGE